MKITEMIRAVQDALGIEVDGKAGPETWTAIYQQLVKPNSAVKSKSASVFLAADISAVGSRSEKVITSLLTEVQLMARV